MKASKPILTLIIFFLYAGVMAPNYANAFEKRSPKTIFVEYSNEKDGGWRISGDDYEDTKHLITQLKKSPLGLDILREAQNKAANQGKTLFDIILPGKTSLTDTTLTRRFMANDPENVIYQQESKVYIDSELPILDAVLDLAHELTHYINRVTFNPYRQNFSLQGFISSTIEDKGGEVDAFMNECLVLAELSPEAISQRANCRKIIDPQTGSLSHQLAQQRFYQIGNYFNSFKNKLAKDNASKTLKQITEQKALFISAVYEMPYPLAAYHEYYSIMKKACENDRKRLGYLKDLTRLPASSNDRNQSIEYFAEDFNRRCQNI